MTPSLDVQGSRSPATWWTSAASPSSGLVFADVRVLDEQRYRDQREYFSISGLQESPHVLAAHLEAAPGNTGDNVVILAALVAQGPQPLHARDLVARRAGALGEFRLDEGHRTGLNSSGMMKSGAWSNPVMRSPRLVSRKLWVALWLVCSCARTTEIWALRPADWA